MAKEMALIIFSCEVYGPYLSKLSAKFECNNTGVVAATVFKKDQEEMILLCTS